MKTYTWQYEQFGWTDLTPHNRQLLEGIEMDFMPLHRSLRQINEAIELSNDQIGKIFDNSEKLSRDNKLRTGFGKTINLPRDAMVKVNDAVGKFGKRLQDSTAVKMFDQKFEQAKDRVKARLGTTNAGRKFLSYIEVLGNAAKEHPRWQAAVIGVLVGASTLVAGPAGALIVGPILKGAAELLKGEKLSTAIGKGIYAGVLGYLGASAASALVHWFEGIGFAKIIPIGPRDLGIEKVSFKGNMIQPFGNHMKEQWFSLQDVIVLPAEKGAISDAILRMGGGDFSAYDDLLKIARKVASPEYIADIKAQAAAAQLAADIQNAAAQAAANQAFADSVNSVGKYFVAAAAGGASALGDVNDNKPATRTSNGAPIVPAGGNRSTSGPPPTSGPISMPAGGPKSSPFEGVQLSLPIMEDMWADLTLQFGAGKLRKAWAQAGRPTNSTDIARMLADMGMQDDHIKRVMIYSGVSNIDAEETMNELRGGADDSELELPFKSGIEVLDKKAARIFKVKGNDEFIAFWEQEITKLEQDLQSKEQIAPPENVSQSLPGPELVSKVKLAIKNKDIDQIKSLISPSQKMSDQMKRVLLNWINRSDLSSDEKSDIVNVIKDATVTEMNMFESISAILKSNKMTWKQLGFQKIILERRTNSVIML